MNEIKYNEENDILKSIKKIIYNYYPYSNDRLEQLYENDQFDIYISINDVINKSSISFSNGHENYRTGTPDNLKIEKLLSLELINELIEFIVNDHTVIRHINVCKSRYIKSIDCYSADIELEFGVNMAEEYMSGIPCRTIGLNIRLSSLENCDSLLNKYLNSIVGRFFESLKNTSFIQEKLNDYLIENKKEILNNMTKEELKQFLDLIDDKYLLDMIFNMNNNQFISTYQKYKELKGRQLTKSLFD